MRKDGRENPVVTRSRGALVAAALELLDQRAAAQISIKDVVEAAGMSRPTFYQHFSDLGAVFAAAGLSRLEQSFADVEPAREAPRGMRHAFAPVLTLTLERMREHAVFFHRVHNSSGAAAYTAGVVAFTAQRLRREPLLQPWADRDEVFWEFLAAGMVWVINRQLAAWCAGEPGPAEADLAGVFDFIFRAAPNH